ncbi:homeobox-leucine zipper protein HAT22-like isoform X1 [Musa acuminata AAA Group]|uniref:homeobox-leucine zipper protein HAT22-like isoform X1 n=1 Tax=Musa acuminata AAA Group TaxID=214697 RepID=UPI0031D22A88
MAEEECNTNLSLAIDGGRQFMPGHRSKPTLHLQVLFPHHPKEEEEEEPIRIPRSKNTEEEEVISGRDNSNCSNDKLFGTRKKLKLTKEQVTLLEDRFREHNTLNTVSPQYYLLHDCNRSEFVFWEELCMDSICMQAQKQDLADRLNIQTRQVEVWFQNRRARTKLKKIEVDYECLKKWCESLSDENRRLKKELQELRSANPGSPFYMHLLKAATLTICPSCERMAAIGGGAAGKSTSAFDGMKGQLVPVKNGLLSRRN